LDRLDLEPILDRAATSPGRTSDSLEGRDRDDRISRLEQALGALRASHADGVYSSSRVINPLLDVWSLAEAVDRAPACPIERLLTTLVGRSVTTSAEIFDCIDEVQAALTRLSAA
jgi:hypothetical protein